MTVVITSREIARSAGVSQATVSRVLHDSTLVAPATRERILAVLAETGYRPNLAARAMRTRRTGTIGVVLADLLNPFYPELLKAIGSSLAARDLRMIVWDTAGAGEQGAVDAIHQRLVDGLIFTTSVASSTALLAAIAEQAPVVLVNRTVNELDCDQVDSNNHDVAYSFAQYFAAHGHERVGLITAEPAASTARDRAQGFVKGARRAGIALNRRHVVSGGFSHAGGAAALRAIMDTPARPTAIFCVNDLSALGAIDAAKGAGLTIPDDLWVVGYDDIDLASWESYELTTARQPLLAMGSFAIELLLNRVDNPSSPRVMKRFISDIKVRSSTASAPLPLKAGPRRSRS